jgi:GTP-binding protein Era
MIKCLFRRFGKLKRQARYVKYRTKEPKEEPKEIEVKQYPKNLKDQNSTIFDPHRRVEYITPKNQVENTFYNDDAQATLGLPKDLNLEETQQRYAEVALIGLPNSGKSSIINKLLSQKLNAVSKIRNTTIENSLNLITDDSKGVQLGIYDTPGLIGRGKAKKGESTRKAWLAMQEADITLLVVDCLRRIDQPMVELLRILQQKKRSKGLKLAKNIFSKIPSYVDSMEDEEHRVALVLNKADLCNNKRRLLKVRDELEDFIHFEQIFVTSAITGFGLDQILSYLQDNAPAGRWLHNPSAVSEKTEVEILEEIARNALYQKTHKELPYKITVKLTELSFRSDKKVFLKFGYGVFKRIQKQILIGKKGKKLRELKEWIARDFMERYGLECEIFIKVSVNKKAELGSDNLELVANEKEINKAEMMDLKKSREERAGSRRRKNRAENFEEEFVEGIDELNELIVR